MKDSPYSYYSKKVVIYQLELKQLEKKFLFIFLIRLLSFMGFIVFLSWFASSGGAWWLPVLSGFSFISFLVAVKTDLNLVRRQQMLQKRIIINQNELKYLGHQYDEFNGGDDFEKLNLHLAGDFDLFGSGSLFQYLNRSVTNAGTHRFAERLCHWTLEKKEIIKYQKSVNELSMKPAFMEDFQARGMLLAEKGKEVDNLLAWLCETEDMSTRLKPLLVIYPVVLIGLIIVVSMGLLSANILWLPVILSFFIVARKKKILDEAHNKLGRNAKTFEKYASLIYLIEQEKFSSPYLINLKCEFTEGEKSASKILEDLFKLLEKFDYRYNFIVAILFNILFLFDLQIYCRLGKWKKLHKKSVSSWFEALAEMDAIIGFGRFSRNNNELVCSPELCEESFEISAQEMGHPLISPENRVSNDISFAGQPKIMVVTGANMAGKSTFLRTLAVNLILAMNGAPVCAKSFRFSPCEIMSSINIRDSLSHKASYFYAELVRIREIIDHVSNQSKTLVVLDEILRGTNTKDKQTGSIGLLEKLISLNAVVVMATHDLTIGELDKKYPDIVTNHCFEVELNDDQLIFDYKVKDGISKKLNASFLMKKMGVIE